VTYAHLARGTLPQELCPFTWSGSETNLQGYLPTPIPIKRGDFLGRTGNAGASSGPHLHLQRTQPLNPLSLDNEFDGLPLNFDGMVGIPLDARHRCCPKARRRRSLRSTTPA
jgi:hypothetical protein